VAWKANLVFFAVQNTAEIEKIARFSTIFDNQSGDERDIDEI
jgi:hypothetical protein